MLCSLSEDDLDLELRLARFEELMDRRPFLLSRYGGPYDLVYCLVSL